MSVPRLNFSVDRRSTGESIEGAEAAFRGELRSSLRRRAIEHGIDPVRVRGLLHTVDQAVAAVRAGESCPNALHHLRGSVSALFPAAPGLDPDLLEQAIGIVMVAAVGSGRALGGSLLEQAAPATVARSDPSPPEGLAPVVPIVAAQLRALRRTVDADPALRALFSARAVGVYLTSVEGVVVKANDRFRTLLGIAEPDALGMRFEDLFQSRLRVTADQRDALARHVSGHERHLTFDTLVHRPDGSNAWISADSALVEANGDHPPYYLGLVEDVTYQRIAMRALRQGEERFLALIQNSSDVFGIVSRQGRVEYMSRSIERVLGYDPDALHGSEFLALADPDEWESLAAALEAALAHPQESRRVGASMVHRDGTRRWMEIDFTNLADIEGVSGVVVSARDVTTRKSVEEQLARLAYYDSLTALPNRVQFREKLEDALESAASTGEVAGVIFFDLDRFKAINDRFGHDGGDAALVAVGQHLTTAMQAGDLAARFGGDEFAVLLRDTSPPQAMRIARRVIRAVGRAFPGRNGLEALGVSAGVALWSTELQTARSLLHAADLALYRSKARGGGVATLYRPELAMREAERDIGQELQLALDRHEMEPWFQPE